MISISFLFVSLLAGVVIWRAGCVASKVSAARFGGFWKFQGFAIGYATLALGAGLVLVRSWRGDLDPASVVMLLASALLVIFDRRRMG